MNPILRLRLSLLPAFLLLGFCAAARAQFTEPTKAELEMTSIPEVPGAPAVYLYREETTEDAHNVFSVYVRLKVLTEKGIDFANVEIPFVNAESGFKVDSIHGRTIHSDGTVYPLTSKPYDKLIEKSGDAKYMSKVFSLPSVEVGSILEYRYKLQSDDMYFRAPHWFIQSKLYTLKAHYVWKPTNQTIVLGGGHEQLSTGIAWVPLLPAGADFKRTAIPAAGGAEEQKVFALDVKNIPPIPEEEFMPPIDSLTYRLIFYYAAATSGPEYWKTQGKFWSKDHDKFIGPGSGVKAAVQQLTAGATTTDEKLRKIYAAVMALENTDFTRQRSTVEERAAGMREIKTSDDVLARKRGSGDQLANLFIAMARAAGMKAYAMSVVDRDRNVFVSAFMDTSQLDDDIAIVNVDGKEAYFDPGQRFCEYGHLAWKHTLATGLRQTDKGVVIAGSPGESYKSSSVKRVANLNMDEQGQIKGAADLTYTGDPALAWRQEALRGDDTSLNKDLRESLEAMVPTGLEVRVTGVDQLADYEHPLVIHYDISGMAGNSTGKRLLVPGDIFRANVKPTFSQVKRTTPVYFHYAHFTQDAVRVHFPETVAVESVPAQEQYVFKSLAAYTERSESTPTSFTVRRDFTLGDVIFEPADFAELRAFYGKFETKDQEPVVLIHKDAQSAVVAKPAT